MNTNSTDFACLVTGFLTDYLPHHRCYSKNTVLSYRDTLKLFLRFLKEEKGISPNSFYITPVYNFLNKKISHRDFLMYNKFATTITKESDPVRQTHYTTKRT